MAPQNDLWVCHQFAPIPIVFTADHDRSGDGVTCTPADQVPAEVKAGYWLYRAFTWLEGL